MEDVARNKDDPFHLHFSDEISTRMDYTVAAFDSKDQFTTTILNINNDTNAGTTTTTTSSISSSRSNIFCDSSKNLMTGISVKNAEEPFSNDPALTASLMDNNISNNYNTLTAFHVRDRIHESWKQINNKSIKSDPLASKKLGDCFTSLQLQMAPFVFNYKDVCYSNDAISVPNNRLQLVNMFCLHIMNHVQK